MTQNFPVCEHAGCPFKPFDRAFLRRCPRRCHYEDALEGALKMASRAPSCKLLNIGAFLPWRGGGFLEGALPRRGLRARASAYM